MSPLPSFNKDNVVFIRNLAFIFAYVLLVLVILFLWHLPTYLSLARYDIDIAKTQFKIEEKKRLQTLYDMLQNEAKKKFTSNLPFPERTTLSKDRIYELFNRIKEICERDGMKDVAIRVRMNTLEGQSKYMVVTVEFKGHFQSLRNVLINILNLPYIERIESIEITQPLNQTLRTFKTVVWVSVTG